MNTWPMSKQLPKDQVEALEKILGVTLPKEGFTLEVRPTTAADELDDTSLDHVTGGANTAPQVPQVSKQQVKAPQQPVTLGKWLVKI